MVTTRARDEARAGPSRRLRIPREELARRLLDLTRAYDGRFLDTDPLGLVRRFERPEDREIAGLVAAGLAYGNVESIRRSVTRLLDLLGPFPADFVDAFDPRRDPERFATFVHRFTRGRDVALLLWLVRRARERAGSLGAFFGAGDTAPQSETLERAMDSFGERLFSLDASPLIPRSRVGPEEPVRWLLPLPAGGSVCKRHCLFLRWMVRSDDGLDCGVWKGISASRLVIPLDTHLLRVAQTLGWTRRRSPSWKMALEVTANLRRLDPNDPTRYDFALSRLGILGRVRARHGRLGLRQLREVLERARPREGALGS